MCCMHQRMLHACRLGVDNTVQCRRWRSALLAWAAYFTKICLILNAGLGQSLLSCMPCMGTSILKAAIVGTRTAAFAMFPALLGRNTCVMTRQASSSLLFFFFFFFLGYRGIVHPPSDDEGTERTWLEPEQRPRKRVPKRSVHGKQSP